MKEKRGEGDSSESSKNEVNKALIKKNYLRKARLLKEQKNIDEKEVYTTIRDFFKEFFEIKYEFTNEEIRKELKRVYVSQDLKDRIKKLFDKISQIEYTRNPLSQKELLSLLKNFKTIVNDLAVIHYKHETSLTKKLRDHIESIFFHHKEKQKEKERNQKGEDNKIPSSPIPEEKAPEETKQNKRPEKSKIEETKTEKNKDQSKGKPEPEKDLLHLMDEIKETLEKNPEEAKILYRDVLEKYNSLDDPSKKKYYKDLQEIYKKLSE